jgi:dienelactone hydrolase
MDEASSVFVDRLALEKIIAEKLSTVHHAPSKQPNALRKSAFFEMAQPVGIPKTLPTDSLDVVLLESPVESDGDESRSLPIHFHPAVLERGCVLLVHGLFEDNRAMYGFLIAELNRAGWSVYMTTLPYHHERTPTTSAFSGEHFFSADLARTKRAFIQAVLEVRAAALWIQSVHEKPVCLTGFSMGGTVALGAAFASDQTEGVCIINPAAMLSTVIWTSPLCATIKADLVGAGWGEREIETAVSSFDPCCMPGSRTRPEDILVIYALYDQITHPERYETLVRQKGFPNVLRYKAGHLNSLRVPRLSSDLVRFFEGKGSSDTSCTERLARRIS